MQTEISKEPTRFPAVIRERAASDDSFIYSSWLKSYRPARANFGVSAEIYYAAQKKVVAALLERSVCLVLCSPDDSAHLFGYIVLEVSPESVCVHYVYVKHPYRRFGFARRLLEALATTERLKCSHIPANLDIWELAKNSYHFEYDPTKRSL